MEFIKEKQRLLKYIVRKAENINSNNNIKIITVTKMKNKSFNM